MNGPRLRPPPALYSSVAGEYLASGLGSPLPLRPRRKEYPPAGWSGIHGKDPSLGQVNRWSRTRALDSNVCLRLSPVVLGLDVDAYEGKQGRRTLLRAEELFGPLPPTFWSTNREDGISGIRYFRAPENRWISGLCIPQKHGEVTGHIDVIQRRHRYAVAPPSKHPSGRLYRWVDPEGQDSLTIPRLAELAVLPAPWVEALKWAEPPARPRTSRTASQAADQSSTSRDRALRAAEGRIRSCRQDRNNKLNIEAYMLGSTFGALDRAEQEVLIRVAVDSGLERQESERTVVSGTTAGARRTS